MFNRFYRYLTKVFNYSTRKKLWKLFNEDINVIFKKLNYVLFDRDLLKNAMKSFENHVTGNKKKEINSILKDDVSDLFNNIDYEFLDYELLTNALKHRSYLAMTKEDYTMSNERLEFLGDAVLNMIVSKYLFKKYSDLPEGELSKKKSAIVSGKNLSKIARNINLGNFLIISKPEEKSGGREKPSLLEDTLEAVIGAIYLDGGLGKAEKFVHRYVLRNIDNIEYDKKVRNYKSELLEYLQGKGIETPIYRVKSEDGPEHRKVFTIEVVVNGKELGEGVGHSKKSAEQKASAEALQAIKDNPTIFSEE